MEKTVADYLKPYAFLILLFAFFSCSEPLVHESFVRQSEKESDGSYRFTVDFGDSLRLNTLYIYALIDAPESAFSRMPDIIPLKIDIESPSGIRYSETVAVPTDSFATSTSYSRQYESLYRSHFTSSEYGQWVLSVSVIGEDRFRGFRGVGFKHIKEEKDNGKR